MKQNPNQTDHKDSRSFKTRKSTYWLALMAEVWERLWPLLVWTFITTCIYAIVSWLGLWRLLEDLPRYILLGSFALAALLSLVPLRKFIWPTRKDLLNRIQTASNLKDRPITAQVDEIANADDEPEDAFSKALWHEHKKRMAQRLENLSSGLAKPNANRLDKYAFRAILPLIAFAAWGYSYSATGGSLIDGFNRHIDPAKILSRLDVWANSPAYTGKAPLYISSKFSSTKSDATDEPKQNENIKLLSGSTLNLRYIGKEDVSAQYKIGNEIIPIENAQETQQNKTQLSEFEVSYILKQNGEFQFLANETIIAAWSIQIENDQKPSIAFIENPASSLSGSLELSYKVEDDFGVIGARGIVRSLEEQNPNARPLVDAPIFDIPLPRRRAKNGASKVNKDLTTHPWAGANIELTLEATDDPGQKGFSQPFKMKMPGRTFRDGLAKALIEQRRILGLDANRSQYVADLLDAVTQFPEEFKIDPKPFLSMRTAYRMIKDAKNNEAGENRLREAMDLLWETALKLEFGDLTEAERKLREAQEKLSQALKNDAGDEEIKKLMDELRTAMNEFIEEMQKQAGNNQDIQNPMDNLDPSQMLSQKDLDKMMDKIEDLARSGSKDAARELLSEMQRMMDNMRSSQQQQNQQANNQLNEALDKLSELMKKQQELLDQSHTMQRQQQALQNQKLRERQNGQQGEQQQPQQQQGQKPGDQPGDMTAEEFAEAMEKLQDQQQALRKQLGEVGDELSELGLDPSNGFGEAESEMGKAGKELGNGEAGSAAGSQSRALQALRDGAQQMMQQMAENQGENGQGQQTGPGGKRKGNDPLGRSEQAGGNQMRDGQTKIPNEIDAQRAREIMEAIRKRLSDPLRPSIERNYLERLLESQ